MTELAKTKSIKTMKSETTNIKALVRQQKALKLKNFNGFQFFQNKLEEVKEVAIPPFINPKTVVMF